MTLRSTGVQRRDFIPIHDVCRATLHLVELNTERVTDGIFNIGGAWSPTGWEMACLIAERCRQLLNFEPTIRRPKPDAKDLTTELDFRIDRLRSTGFELQADRIDEIDSTLLFCRNIFGDPA